MRFSKKVFALALLISFYSLPTFPFDWGPEMVRPCSGTAAATGSLSVPYPPGIQANDRILLQLGIRNNGDTPTTPAGFSVLFSADADGGTSRQYVYCHDADGTETGNLTLTITGSADVHIARMYLFRRTAACASLYEAAGLAQSFDPNVPAVNVTTTGNYRLGVAFVALGGGGASNPVPVSFTNEHGGDWISQAWTKSTLGNHQTIQLQIAPLPATGTISGGNYNIGVPGTENINRSFALLPDPVPPANTTLTAFQLPLLPFTHQQIFTSSGTWTRPLNVDVVFVRIQAPGGGGGGGQGAQGVGDDPGGGGAGGGSGQFVEDFLEVSANIAVTINAPGSGGAGSVSEAVSLPGDPGTNGGTASFGSIVAQGGDGGDGGQLVTDAPGGTTVPAPTPGGTGTSSSPQPVQYFGKRGERGLQGGQGSRIGGNVQKIGASSALFAGGPNGAAGAAPALGTGAGGGGSTELGIGGTGGDGGTNVHFAGFSGQTGQGAGSGGGGGGGGATFSVGGVDADGAAGGNGAAGRVEVYW